MYASALSHVALSPRAWRGERRGDVRGERDGRGITTLSPRAFSGRVESLSAKSIPKYE